MRIPPIHPFLFAVYPILFLWSSNFGSVSHQEILVPFVISVGAAAVLLLIPYFCFGWDLRKIGIWTSFFICTFFSYWVLQRLASYALVGNPFGLSNYYFLPIWAFIMFLGTAYIARIRGNLDKATSALNLLSCLLIVFSGVNIVRYSVETAHATPKPVEARLDNVTSGQKEMTRAVLDAGQGLPDIYYIILDAYGRSDVLKNTYEYDNNAFLDWLAQKGFYVVENSRANYCHTALSLASSLNYTLLDNLLPEIVSQQAGYRVLTEMIRNSRISSVLKGFGYKTLAFSSGYPVTEMKSADFYLLPPWNSWEFHNAVISMTPLYAFSLRWFQYYGLGYDCHRRRLSFISDNLAEVGRGKEPVFVFCHLVTPHPPFVFDEQGRPLETDQPFSFNDGTDLYGTDKSLQDRYRFRYTQQVQFINSKIKAAIETIISRSERSPIIIIQADHGPGTMLDLEDSDPLDDGLTQRLSILNAIYVPEQMRRFLYPDMTPVNTFRIILKHGFGQPLELLPDKSYYCIPSDLFRLTDVTERIR